MLLIMPPKRNAILSESLHHFKAHSLPFSVKFQQRLQSFATLL